jgi:hypothetical protein
MPLLAHWGIFLVFCQKHWNFSMQAASEHSSGVANVAMNEGMGSDFGIN